MKIPNKTGMLTTFKLRIRDLPQATPNGFRVIKCAIPEITNIKSLIGILSVQYYLHNQRYTGSLLLRQRCEDSLQ